MKFRSKNGSIHNTLIGAMTSGATQKIENAVRSKLPGYKEAINNNFNISIEEDDFNYSSYEDEFFDEEDIEDDEGDYFEHDEMIEDHIESNNMAEKDEVTDEILQQDIPEELNITSEKKEESKNHIEIDYARNKLYLKDEEGNILAENEIDPILTTGIIDSNVFKILYPEGNIPKDIKSNTISPVKERGLQDKKTLKEKLDEMNDRHYNDTMSVKNILNSNDHDEVLENQDISEETINNLTGNN